MRVSMLAGAALALAAAVTLTTPAQAQSDQAEEIVVTARRIGIPVWRVIGPKTSLVLIGSIGSVAKGTQWDAGALSATLRKADRVMFPGLTSVEISPFSAIGYYMKWRRMGTLPKGQTLAGMMTPEQFRQLAVLKDRGVLKPGFERKHPLHLSVELRNKVNGQVGEAPGVDRFVREAVKKHKLKMVPITSVSAKPIAQDFFSTPARAYIPCLLASAALVQAGPSTIREHSKAWAERRVRDVLGSPAEAAFQACIPPAARKIDGSDLRPQISALMQDPRLTVAVVGLPSLAKPGGVLDHLAASGYKISGPQWK